MVFQSPGRYAATAMSFKIFHVKTVSPSNRVSRNLPAVG